MVTNEYLNSNNKHLLFLLPGQSLSPRAFWDFSLPEGKTHAKIMFESGIDILMFDPVGYGDSPEWYQYDRIGYADQIEYVMSNFIHKEYKSKTILGFSSTTAPALIAGERGLFDKIIIHSPSIRNDGRYYVRNHDDAFETGIEKLISNRLYNISDRLIPKPNRIDNWKQRILDTIGKSEWKVPFTTVNDINNYWCLHKNNGFDPTKVPPILSILGEYDYEATTGGYDEFKRLFPALQEVVIPNSTHFSMWENESSKTRLEIVKYCLTNNQN